MATVRLVHRAALRAEGATTLVGRAICLVMAGSTAESRPTLAVISVEVPLATGGRRTTVAGGFSIRGSEAVSCRASLVRGPIYCGSVSQGTVGGLGPPSNDGWGSPTSSSEAGPVKVGAISVPTVKVEVDAVDAVSPTSPTAGPTFGSASSSGLAAPKERNAF